MTSELWQASTRSQAEHNIVFRRGSTRTWPRRRLWGAPMHLTSLWRHRVDGVFGVWYGKGPGVDRSGDVLRHANFTGVSPKGGAIALAGDDHGGEIVATAGSGSCVLSASRAAMAASASRSAVTAKDWAESRTAIVASSPDTAIKSSGPLTPSSCRTSAILTDAPRISSSSASDRRAARTFELVVAFASKRTIAVRSDHLSRSRSGRGPCTS